MPNVRSHPTLAYSSHSATTDYPRAAKPSSLGIFFFVGWFVSTSLLGAYLVGQHGPTDTASAELKLASVGQAHTAWYVLGSDCGISDAVADRLIARGPAAHLAETVWLLADEPRLKDRLRAAGFTVERADAVPLDGLTTVRRAPWLALFNAEHHLTYSHAL